MDLGIRQTPRISSPENRPLLMGLLPGVDNIYSSFPKHGFLSPSTSFPTFHFAYEKKTA